MMKKKGKVYLTGAGPGDPGLITIKALQILKSADVVIYDRLAPSEVLTEAPAHAELIDVGKSSGQSTIAQDEINQIMINKARDGKRVCRLKGGDPFVFGRGGEEAIALTAGGVDWEMVPGVSSAIAVPAYSGIPVTHRGVSSGAAIVTGSEDPQSSQSTVNWNAVAQFSGSVVILMGAMRMAEISDVLIENGKSPQTPAAATYMGTHKEQQTVVGNLGDIASIVKCAGMKAPITLTIGDAVTLREQIAWFDTLPLFEKRVLVTRARSQASRLSKRLQDAGATVVECPVIKIDRLEDTSELLHYLARLEIYDWVTFASPNSVVSVWEQLQDIGLDSRAFSSCKIAAVGPATKTALQERGIYPDLIPDNFTSEGMIEAFKLQSQLPRKVLAFKSDIGHETIPQGLRELGADVDEVAAYRTVTQPESGQLALNAYAEGVDITTFTSSSTVNNLMALIDDDAAIVNQGLVACIGPKTAATARSKGLNVDIIPEEQSIQGLVKAIIRQFTTA